MLFVSLINCSSSSLFHCSFVVCRDGSCSNDGSTSYLGGACQSASIPFVVGPSCTDTTSCRSAQIGSVDSSCTGADSCLFAEFMEADLINSCKKEDSCYIAKGRGLFTKLEDCCNDEFQCKFREGICVSFYCVLILFLIAFLSNDSLFSHSCISY